MKTVLTLFSALLLFAGLAVLPGCAPPPERPPSLDTASIEKPRPGEVEALESLLFPEERPSAALEPPPPPLPLFISPFPKSSPERTLSGRGGRSSTTLRRP